MTKIRPMLREACTAAAVLSGVVSPSLAAECLPSVPSEAARIDSFSERGEIITHSGERLRLAGIALRSEPSPAGLQRFSSVWRGATIHVQRLSQGPDRWGRVSAMVSAQASLETLPPLVLNTLMLDEGLAIADPADVPVACRASFSVSETAARRRRSGIWQDQTQIVVSGTPTQAQALAHAGSFRMVEGKVQRVTERRGQIFIDFGRFGSLAPSLRVSRRNIAHIMPSGMAVAELKGRSLRVRGMMETSGERLWMTLDRASLIEVLD